MELHSFFFFLFVILLGVFAALVLLIGWLIVRFSIATSTQDKNERYR